jgi:hypothetical protein
MSICAASILIEAANMKPATAFVLVLHAFVIWLGCGLTVAIGRGTLGLDATLQLHAIVAPAGWRPELKQLFPGVAWLRPAVRSRQPGFDLRAAG